MERLKRICTGLLLAWAGYSQKSSSTAPEKTIYLGADIATTIFQADGAVVD